MKYFQFKITLLSLAIAGIALSSCKKVEVPEDTQTKGQKIVSFITYGGLEAFAASSLIVDLSQPVVSQEYYFKYSGPTVFPTDVTITVGYDDAALTAYNAAATASGGLVYTKLPSNFYLIKNPTVKIPAGTAISEALKVDIYANMLDPSVSYMFPISIKTISGASSDVVKAPGTGIAYFHIIGNPLAGAYKRSFYRWNATTDTTTAPNSTVTLDVPVNIAPVT